MSCVEHKPFSGPEKSSDMAQYECAGVNALRQNSPSRFYTDFTKRIGHRSAHSFVKHRTIGKPLLRGVDARVELCLPVSSNLYLRRGAKHSAELDITEYWQFFQRCSSLFALNDASLHPLAVARCVHLCYSTCTSPLGPRRKALTAHPMVKRTCLLFMRCKCAPLGVLSHNVVL